MSRKDVFKVKGMQCQMPVYQYTWTSLNLRAEKSVISEVLTVIPSYTRFEVIDTDSLWLQVVYDGQVGFVCKQAVSVSEIIQHYVKSTVFEQLKII